MLIKIIENFNHLNEEREVFSKKHGQRIALLRERFKKAEIRHRHFDQNFQEKTSHYSK